MTSIEAQWLKEIRDNTKQLRRIADKLDVIARLITKDSTQPDDYFRNPTVEERESVRRYIKSISEPTGVNFYDSIEDTLVRDCSTCGNWSADWDSEKCDDCIIDVDKPSNYEPLPEDNEVRCIGCINAGTYKCTRCDGDIFYKTKRSGQ